MRQPASWWKEIVSPQYSRNGENKRETEQWVNGVFQHLLDTQHVRQPPQKRRTHIQTKPAGESSNF